MAEKRVTKSIRTFLSAPQILILGSLVLVFLLATIGFAIMLNRQLVIQRQTALARAEYKSVYNISQLDREVLRLSVLSNMERSGLI